MVCHFGQTRNGSMASHFILLSSTATSSATDVSVVVPKRLVRMSNQLVEMNNEIEKNLVLFPEVYLINALKSHVIFSHVKMIFRLIFYLIFDVSNNILLIWENRWISHS